MRYSKLLALLSLLMLSACISVKSPDENLQDLSSGKVAAVISGCKYIYKTKNIILPNSIETHSCLTRWKKVVDHNGTQPEHKQAIRFDGYSDISFIEAGRYSFDGYYVDMGDVYYYFDQDEKKPLEILTDFTVKAGEVIYIGDIEIDVTESNLVINSISPAYYKLSAIERVVGKEYPSLVNRIEERYIDLTKFAKFARKYIPMIDERK